MGMWQSLRHLAMGTVNRDKLYDEERVNREFAPRWRSWPTKRFRLPRLKKTSVWLLLLDSLLVILLVRTLDPLITLLRRNEELFGARFTVSQEEETSVSSKHSPQHKIPRILHQTCANDTVPSVWVNSQHSCKEAYSDYEYKVCSQTSKRYRLGHH